MKAKLVRIGNSRGVRIPKPLIDQVGLADEVELEIEGGAVVIRPAAAIRAGWAQAAAALAETRPHLLDPVVETTFDRDEWVW